MRVNIKRNVRDTILVVLAKAFFFYRYRYVYSLMIVAKDFQLL